MSQRLPTPEFPEDVLELVSASLDGALTPAEEERLADLLAQDPALHAYRERMRRMKRLLVKGGPLLVAPEGKQALADLDARLAQLPAEAEGQGLSWKHSLGIGFCLLGLVVVVAQAVAFSRRHGDASDAPPQQSELGPVPVKQPDVPEEPAVDEPDGVVEPPEEPETPPVDEPDPVVEPPESPEQPPVDAPEEPEAPPVDEPDVVVEAPEEPPPPTPPKTLDDPTRVRPTPQDPPQRPALDLEALRRLVAGIHAADTPLEQRPSLIRSLGDPRFDHPLAYETLAALLAGKLDRSLPVGQVQGARIGPPEWRAAARVACARLDSALAARVLLETLREDELAAGEAALASLRSDASVGALAEALSGRVSALQAEATVRALAAIGDPAGYPAVLKVFGNGRLPGALVEQAALAMGALGDPSTLGPLEAGLDDARLQVRAGAAGGLGRLGARLPDCADASVDALTGALKDDALSVCRAAAAALATVGEPGVPPLIACLDPSQEPRAAVRDAAREQLWLLSGEPLADAALAAEWWRRHQQGDAPLARPTGVLTVDPGAGPLALASWGERAVFMLDTSGSMGGAKWARAQEEVERAIDAFARARGAKERAWVNLLAFADAPRFVRPGFMNVATRSGRAGALKLLGQLKPVAVAQTDLPQAFGALGGIAKVDTLVLVSDAGQTVDALLRTLSVVRQLRARRPLVIHTVWLRSGQGPLIVDRGAGHPDDPAGAWFMRTLARESGGLFVRER
ncbi:MAG: VWA domain-containing protein [Planctomycetota bacterium]